MQGEVFVSDISGRRTVVVILLSPILLGLIAVFLSVIVIVICGGLDSGVSAMVTGFVTFSGVQVQD